MTPPTAARDSVAEALRSLGLTDEPEKFDDGIHSWRCSHPDIYGRCACFADAVSDILSAVDWRVLGGLVPGVIIAAWLRIGDRVRIAAVEGVVIAHTVRAVEDVALFVLRTDRGVEIACERWTGSEVAVVVTEEPQTADEGAQAPRPDVETPHSPSAPAPSSAPTEMTQEEFEAAEAARDEAEISGQEAHQ